MTAYTTAETLTTAQIRKLRSEAARVADLEMVATCDAALQGIQQARVDCARVISDAEAMEA